MKKTCITVLFMVAIILSTGCSRAADSKTGVEVVPGIPVKNTVTMVDLGAGSCIPCKLMAPILAELQEEYEGRAAIIFIDVWEAANKEKARAFKITAIPTQIFFDRNGREVYRHVGFLDKDSIVGKLEALLAE